MVRQFFITSAAFMWAGCIIAISFMEAWLKFIAPCVTLSIGLGIGKLVFHALNRMECVFAAVILGCYLINNPVKETSALLLMIIATSILLVQTFWLLPALNERATAVINGKEISPSNLELFPHLEQVLTNEQLENIGKQLNEKHTVAKDDFEDEFWVNKK